MGIVQVSPSILGIFIASHNGDLEWFSLAWYVSVLVIGLGPGQLACWRSFVAKRLAFQLRSGEAKHSLTVERKRDEDFVSPVLSQGGLAKVNA